MIKIVPSFDQLKKLYSIPELRDEKYNAYEGLVNEIISLYGKYPLSDLHLYVFSCYDVFSNTVSNFNRKLGLIEIGDEFFNRFIKIYKFDKLALLNKSIYFNNNGKNVKIEIDNSYKNIYKKVYEILQTYEHSNDMNRTARSFCDFLFKEWRIENFRYLAYFTEIYMQNFIDYRYFSVENPNVRLSAVKHKPQNVPNPLRPYDEIKEKESPKVLPQKLYEGNIKGPSIHDSNLEERFRKLNEDYKGVEIKPHKSSVKKDTKNLEERLRKLYGDENPDEDSSMRSIHLMED